MLDSGTLAEMPISEMVYCGMNEQKDSPLLSKWWKTKSAKAATKRAVDKRKKKHAQWIAKVKAYRAAQHAEIFGS